ncbi:MAG: ATP-binding cassette domain-containing protein, partial [Cycloclasticus sp.]|nr:ATP-binding cassette domain-containing protein [Cycloclasticus sp.]
MSNLIDYKNISMALSGNTILKINHLAIPAHQCTLLTGKNGSGKTTLLKIMSGLLKPNSATIHY